MKTLRSTRTLASFSSVLTLALLIGGAFVGRAFSSEPLAAAASGEEESPMLCQRAALLLESGAFSEADRVLLSLPSAPLRLESPESQAPCPQRRRLLMRLADGLIQAARRLATEGHGEEAQCCLRQCRSLLVYPGRSAEAVTLARQLIRRADETESHLPTGARV
jgi:hypothetical protein